MKQALHDLFQFLKTEAKYSVASYFAPVRAVYHEMVRSVHEATRDGTDDNRLGSHKVAATKH